MNILNLYFSGTGNTKKVADMIAETSNSEGHAIETIRIRKTMETEFDVLDYDFDHLGFEIIGEWYIVGEFHGGFRDFSKAGKLGDITGRPNEQDLREISEMVKGVLKING